MGPLPEAIDDNYLHFVLSQRDLRQVSSILQTGNTTIHQHMGKVSSIKRKVAFADGRDPQTIHLIEKSINPGDKNISDRDYQRWRMEPRLLKALQNKPSKKHSMVPHLHTWDEPDEDHHARFVRDYVEGWTLDQLYPNLSPETWEFEKHIFTSVSVPAGGMKKRFLAELVNYGRVQNREGRVSLQPDIKSLYETHGVAFDENTKVIDIVNAVRFSELFEKLAVEAIDSNDLLEAHSPEYYAGSIESTLERLARATDKRCNRVNKELADYAKKAFVGYFMKAPARFNHDDLLSFNVLVDPSTAPGVAVEERFKAIDLGGTISLPQMKIATYARYAGLFNNLTKPQENRLWEGYTTDEPGQQRLRGLVQIWDDIRSIATLANLLTPAYVGPYTPEVRQAIGFRLDTYIKHLLKNDLRREGGPEQFPALKKLRVMPREYDALSKFCEGIRTHYLDELRN